MSAPRSGKEERPRPPAGDRGLLKKVPAEPRLFASRIPRHRFGRWLFNGSVPEPGFVLQLAVGIAFLAAVGWRRARR